MAHVDSAGEDLFFVEGLGDRRVLTFLAPVDDAARGYAWDLKAGDFNSDTLPDLVGSDGSVLIGNADGTFQLARAPGASGLSLAVGEFNNDGKLDLAARSDYNPG